MKLTMNNKLFMKDMNNIMEYSFGFLEGVQRGKTVLYKTLGPQIAEMASNFIDSNARMNPENLHHVYEWYRTGSPDARLFDIDYVVSNLGITFNSKFKQSTTIKDGSYVPFYNKATIMESGAPVVIMPKKANALRFEIDGEAIYTKNPVTVDNPGGNSAGQFENVVDMFFNVYFRQTFLRVTGLDKHFKNPSVFKRNIKRGKSQGRSAGIQTGFQWVANAGVLG